VQVTQAVLPAMIGRIVNVTSMVTVGRPDRTAYGAAKAALEFCSRAWAGELASTGITVNSVAPAICFLLSEDAGFITGQTLRVDGGGSIGAA
jgi:NAD(P)-dependent dehydrogenase (short-subunit alcohol dehydrogenase family)